jgi:hypothetical protein
LIRPVVTMKKTIRIATLLVTLSCWVVSLAQEKYHAKDLTLNGKVRLEVTHEFRAYGQDTVFQWESTDSVYYSNAGNYSSRSRHSNDSNETIMDVYRYDSTGVLLLQHTSCNHANGIERETSWEYDHKGFKRKRTRTEFFGGNYKTAYLTYYSYDTLCNTIREVSYIQYNDDKDSAFLSGITRLYGPGGQLIKELEDRGSWGNLKGSVEFEYDLSDRIIKKTTQGIGEETEVYEYDSAGKKTMSKYYKGPEMDFYIIHQYNADGDSVKQLFYRPTGVLVFTSDFTYRTLENKKRVLESITGTEHERDGRIDKTYETKFEEYDFKDNLLKMSQYIEGKKCYYLERKIYYY